MHSTIQRLIPIALFFLPASFAADSSSRTVLEWAKTVSGSGKSSAASAAVDQNGNLYITGGTTSLDFPTVSAAQRNAGGSPLIRIHPAVKSAQKLYSPDIAGLQSITVDPKNPSVLYGATATTLLRSTNSGSSWKNLPALPGVTALLSVTVDPTNDSILYLGTSPVGILKSTDAGATWTAMNNGVPQDSNEGSSPYGYATSVKSLNVYQIWIDPKSPSVLFAATNSGVVRSANGGSSWTVVLPFFAGSLVFDPFVAGTIYATQEGNLSKSSDEGQTWTTVASLPGQLVTELLADPFHKGFLYAANYRGLYQSADSGLTWTLKVTGQITTLAAADPNQPVLYAETSALGIISSTDGFNTYSTIVPATTLGSVQPSQMLVAGAFVFLVAAPTTDVFVTKLDPDGNIVYSTYFGGSGADSPTALAVGKDGSVYITGSTGSTDFPVTKGAYATSFPTSGVIGGLMQSAPGASFVFKLNPDGSVAWSTYFTDALSGPVTIAVDAEGNPYIGGWSSGDLPTTPGVYQTQFQSAGGCGPGNIGPCPTPATSAFLTKFDAQGSGLAFSTYIPQDAKNIPIDIASTLALAPSGNLYFSYGGSVYLMNAAGSALLASNSSANSGITSIALDADGDVYAAGYDTSRFVTTPGAFQTSQLPVDGTGAGNAAFVVKYNSTLSKVLAATLLGGEALNVAQSLAIDPAGNVMVSGYTDSKAFPVHGPFQGSFAARSGFVAGLDSSLSHLLFSTYLGDVRPFAATTAVPDGKGNILVVGSTLASNGSYYYADPGSSFSDAVTAIANKIAIPPAPAVRLDSVVNFASQLGVPLSPGEAFAAIGTGFGSDAAVLFDGMALPVISWSASRIVAVVPSDEKTSGAVQVTVRSGGVLSNAVAMPAAAVSPAIYSVDGSGFGQGYILNSDGSRNSKSNPAAVGSAITILATGVGPVSEQGQFVQTDQPVAVFVDGLYASGIAAKMKQVPGLPGQVYELGVYIPDPSKLVNQNPALKGFTLPPEDPVTLFIGPVMCQTGIEIWVRQN